jgi:ferredoxin
VADLFLTQEKAGDLLKHIAGKGLEVFAPVKKDGTHLIEKITENAAIDFTYFITTNSIKEALFPRYEKILSYKISQEGVELEDVAVDKSIVIFGGHPCDAASIPLMEKLFAWDYKDKFFLQRLEKTTIITLACEEADKDCFCTSLGYSPRGEIGSDILLERVSDQGWKLKIITEKGNEFAKNYADYFQNSLEADKQYPKLGEKDIPVQFDSKLVKKWIDTHFEDPLWEKIASNCWSCAACTYVCPTCHCFDITDDATMWSGIRTKNWDACTLPFFTLHASQHNPREQHFQRYRQRINHKYSIYMNLFNAISCTGCGRCSRACGAKVNILEAVKMIATAAGGK